MGTLRPRWPSHLRGWRSVGSALGRRMANPWLRDRSRNTVSRPSAPVYACASLKAQDRGKSCCGPEETAVITLLTASSVADWFIAWAEHNDADVSNLKVQKLLYYAQGNYLAQTGTPLFKDRIEAWAHGPVVQSVYRRFREYQAAAIDPDCVPDSFNWDDYQDVASFLQTIWNTYGEYSAWKLRNMTHTEPPWIEAFNNGDSRNAPVSIESMTKFFKALTNK